MELKLKATNSTEILILEYIKKNATEALAEKINAGDKTLKGCWNFIVGEAQRKAVGGCACVEDREVYGWAMHYFEEDSVKECKTAPKAAVSSPLPKKAPKKKTVNPIQKSFEQPTLFDIMG